MTVPSRVYAGIGSRGTPSCCLDLMRRLGAQLAERRWTLRTGGADGADQAFLDGARQVRGVIELYLPWPGFSGHRAATLTRPTVAAYDLAARYHPAWHRLGSAARALHARNTHQVLGADLLRTAAMVVCWTPDGTLDGTERGGTSQALRLATAHGVRVINLRRPDHTQRAHRWLDGVDPTGRDA